MKLTLIISTYNWPNALELVFKSILLQSIYPSEIIIADDGSTEDTKMLIGLYRSELPIPVIHIWHQDQGFRKTIVLNKAVHSASGDYVIQIDGDIILHRQFIKDHLSNAERGFFIKGSRGMINKKLTSELLRTKKSKINVLSSGLKSKINSLRFPLLSPLFYGNQRKTNDLRGCNFAFWKDDFVAVNGYNNDLNGWGHEDIELAARLVNYGIKRKQLKMAAVCYHLYHKISSRKNELRNFEIYRDAVSGGLITCTNGYLEAISQK